MSADRSPLASTRRARGLLGEELAAAHLLRRGYSILERNVRTRHGEIDLIAYGAGAIVFVEVKTRRCATRGGVEPGTEPLTGLRAGQRLRLRRLAVAWLSEARPGRPSAHTIRFDAVGVTLDRRDRLVRLEHLEAAW